MAKGTCTISEKTSGSMKKIKWDFVSGSGASVNSITTPTTTAAFNGLVKLLTTIGGASMSASWDITIKDQSSVDILAGAGASRAATTEQTKEASLGGVANDTLTLTIANTGASHAGEVHLLIR